jgi:poly-gamma-glutamate synthase PgsB/CapB
MLILIFATLSLIIFWIIEYIRHYRNIKKIPVRVHVNGTRGKSSVTRLISAGLRAGGLKTIAKTTGTLPRVIHEDGTESAIVRLAGANIIEQKYILRHVAAKNPDVLVIECMAVNPVLQWITERKFVQSTISVITNSRLDHLDLMGETIQSVTKCLCNTIPDNGVCYTSEKEQFKIMKEVAEKRNTEIHSVSPTEISAKDMEDFGYIEHPDNVALALEICKKIGVPKNIALKGMQKMPPDPGALKKYIVVEDNKKIVFYNVFAANDPDSTKMIWLNIISHLKSDQQKIIILNSRADRYFRSIQLLDVCSKLDFDYLLLTGERTEQLFKDALKRKIDKRTLKEFGELKTDILFEKIKNLTIKESHIVGIGNIAGARKYGGQIVKYFKEKSLGGR